MNNNDIMIYEDKDGITRVNVNFGSNWYEAK